MEKELENLKKLLDAKELSEKDYLGVMAEIEEIKTAKKLEHEKAQEDAQIKHEEYLRETCSPEWYAYLMCE
jgi:uncharacterized membrane protein